MPRNSLPQNYLIDKGSVLENFNTPASFIAQTNCTLSADTSNYLEGSQGLLAAAITTGTAYQVDKLLSWDLSASDNFTFCFYVFDKSQFSSMTIYLLSSSGWFNYDIPATYIIDGWNYFQLNKNQFNNYNSADSFTKLRNRIRFTVTPVSGYTCPITFGGIYTNRKSIPKVVLTFDDGYATVLSNAYPYLNARGIKATCYVISDTVQDAGATSYMRKSNLDTLYNAGWDISNHTKNHYDLSTFTHADQLTQLQTCMNYLQSCGYTRSYMHVAYPVGKYNSDTISICNNLGIKTARTTANKFQTIPCENLLKIGIAGSGTTMIKTCSYIYEALKNGQTVFIMLHNIGSSGTNLTSIADFQYLIDFLYQLNVKFMTISEWYKGLISVRKGRN